MGQEIGAAPLGPANRSRTRRAISRVRRRRLRNRSRLGGGWRIDVEGLNSIFSLSPSGGEGRGEGANVASHSNTEFVARFPPHPNPLPQGGEGTTESKSSSACSQPSARTTRPPHQ